MNAHRVEILNGTDHDTLVLVVAHHFHFVFLPTGQALLDHDFSRRGCFQSMLANFLKVFPVVGNAPAGSAQRKARPNDQGEGSHIFHGCLRLFQAVHNPADRHVQPDLDHRLLEQLPVFTLLNGIVPGSDHLDPVLLQDPLLVQGYRQVQRRLSPERGQQGVRLFGCDYLLKNLYIQRLYVRHIRKIRIGHNSGRVAVDQHHAVAFFTQCLACLRATIVELTGLTNNDWSGSDNEDGFNVLSLGH